MSSPLSVIVPTFNGARFVQRTLDSLARQTLPLEEIIVVDDGSTDNTVELVRDHPSNATVLRQPNQGVAVARNRGVLHAHTEYVALVDQDDLWHSARHERLLAVLSEHPDCGVLTTSARSFYVSGDAPRLAALGDELHKSANFPNVEDEADLMDDPSLLAECSTVVSELTTRALLAESLSVTITHVFHRDALLTSGGFPTIGRSMDDYLAVVLMSRTHRILRCEQPTHFYRLHPSATSQSSNWPLPLLAMQIAARYGDNLISLGDARDRRAVAPLTDAPQFLLHQLLQMIDGGRLRDAADAAAVLQLLSCDRQDRLYVGTRLTKRWLRAVSRRMRRQLD